MYLTHGRITISPMMAVIMIPSNASFENFAAPGVLIASSISKNNDPQMLGIASINEKLIACLLSNPSILDVVKQIPNLLTPGNRAIVSPQPIKNAFDGEIVGCLLL